MSYRPITDVWILARPKHKYYGAYPAGFLQRARDLMGVTIYDPLLHVCSGMVRKYPFRGVGLKDRTVDIDPKVEPDYEMDVRLALPRHRGRGWAGGLIDTPYSPTEADNYNSGSETYPQPQKLVADSLRVVRPGGRVGILHYQWPRHPKMLDGVPIRSVALVLVVMGQGNNGRLFSVFERMDDRARLSLVVDNKREPRSAIARAAPRRRVA